ncbi:Betaine aldehyde dehydrogenase, chloroplastic [Tetrabaena socialis]|uniref:Betaine aldehyde dehydrogenase, chloroplastic n=1 Tax=Tetrabaena socialis TaxID=47790 RepID=A0A2J7ZZT8_9CHLO|nr:Betaine aldehyde dehydrogenase, chloroplastic [Tetrabaena socialis]|eukprot:PNH05780.1 Betaine aldehyde dehydrogenase, chloroplastic [Tetrabaena socialis]
MESPVPQRQLYIGGAFVPPVKGQYMDVLNPANEQVFTRIPAGTAEDVDAAVKAATAAFKSGHWSKATGAYRAKFLRAIAQKVRDLKLVLAKTETMDCGKPIDEAEWDMDDVATCFDFYAGQAEALDGRNADAPAIDVGMAEFDVRVRREALGVVGLISPWNYPCLVSAAPGARGGYGGIIPF